MSAMASYAALAADDLRMELLGLGLVWIGIVLAGVLLYRMGYEQGQMAAQVEGGKA